MPGAMTLKLTERGRRAIRNFRRLGRAGERALMEALEAGAVLGATYAFRSFRDRKQYGTSNRWKENKGRWATFKQNILGQRPPIPGQGVTGRLKRSIEFESRSPHKARRSGRHLFYTKFGTNLPYAHRFTTGGGARAFMVDYHGKAFHFYQGTAPRPFMPEIGLMRRKLRGLIEMRLRKMVMREMNK